MRKIYTYIIIIYLIFTSSIFSKEIPLINDIFQTSDIFRLKSYGEQVAAIGVNYWYLPGKNYLYLFEGEKWNDVPLAYKNSDGKIDSIKYSLKSRPECEFDRFGKLWTCGIGGFFKWDGKEWLRFFINDSFAEKREFKRLCFDSLGRIWLTSQFYK